MHCLKRYNYVKCLVYLVAASIIATIGIPGKVASLEKSNLISSEELNNTDGGYYYKKNKSFFKRKKFAY